jgi:4-hydroxybenzoate polyprenyltransferase
MIKSYLKKISFYIDCARPSHWIKNIFMLPGFILALTIENEFTFEIFSLFFIGFLSTCLLSSANYSLNEILDRNYDKNHPVKKNRPLAQGYIYNLPIALNMLAKLLWARA